MCPPRDARSSTKTVSASCYLYLIDIWLYLLFPLSILSAVLFIYLFIYVYLLHASRLFVVLYSYLQKKHYLCSLLLSRSYFVMCSLILLVVFFCSVLSFQCYRIGGQNWEKNTTKGINEHTTKTEGISVKTFFNLSCFSSRHVQL